MRRGGGWFMNVNGDVVCIMYVNERCDLYHECELGEGVVVVCIRRMEIWFVS